MLSAYQGLERGVANFYDLPGIPPKEIAALLLAAGAAVNAKTPAGYTPLFFAASVGARDVVDLLLANQADVYAIDNTGKTPLQVPAILGHPAVVSLLREHGGR